MNNKKNKILILAAHPDDEVLGCGGVIQKHKKEDANIFVCIITDGSSVQYPNNTQIALKKKKECELANKILDVDHLIYLDLPDMQLDTIPHFELNKKLEIIIEKIKPNIIYTHSPNDLNKDHFLINQSSMIVTRLRKPYLKEIYEYEVLSSTEWNRNSIFIPNTFVNITDFIEKKIESFKKYQTEIRKYPHPRSEEEIKILARYRGIQSGYKYAEAFKLVLSYK